MLRFIMILVLKYNVLSYFVNLFYTYLLPSGHRNERKPASFSLYPQSPTITETFYVVHILYQSVPTYEVVTDEADFLG